MGPRVSPVALQKFLDRPRAWPRDREALAEKFDLSPLPCDHCDAPARLHSALQQTAEWDCPATSVSSWTNECEIFGGIFGHWYSVSDNSAKVPLLAEDAWTCQETRYPAPSRPSHATSPVQGTMVSLSGRLPSERCIQLVLVRQGSCRAHHSRSLMSQMIWA